MRTPPIRTIVMYNIGVCNPPLPGETQTIGTYCVAWDGSYNLDGMFGKRNGQYGFRARARINQVSPTAGNISIEQLRVFPGQNQTPIQVDVVDIHSIAFTPRIINGIFNGVDIKYRLSKDALTTIIIKDSYNNTVRNLINSAPRIGEGYPNGTLTNSDFWDGRDNNDNLLPQGNYLAYIDAHSEDSFGTDTANTTSFIIPITTAYININIRDINVKNLNNNATDYAQIFYKLNENATTYLDIFPQGTVFNNINCSTRSVSDLCFPNNPPIISLSSYTLRDQISSFIWEGKDSNGNYLCDGNYVFALSALNKYDIWTNSITTTTISINRGNVLSDFKLMNIISTNSLTLNPVYFSFDLKRPAKINLRIFDNNDNEIVALLSDELFSQGTHQLLWGWDKIEEKLIDVGSYKAKFITEDEFNCSMNKISTNTLSFSFNPFFIYDFNVSTESFENPLIFKFKTFKLSNVVYEIFDEQNNLLYKTTTKNSKTHYLPWNGRDFKGLRLKNGTYKLKLKVYPDNCNEPYDNCNLKYNLDYSFLLDRPVITDVNDNIPINEKKEVSILMPDKEIKIDIPPQTFTQDVIIKVSTVSLSTIGGSFDDVVKPLDFTFQVKNDKNEQPQKAVKFYIDYNENDFVGIDENKLVVTRYVPQNGRWVILKSKVYPDINRIEAETDHFSVFNLSQLVPANSLSNLRIYPNPFNPIKHTYGMKITGLPSECKIKIFTITGELVKKIDCDGSGFSIWDGRSSYSNIVGSGVYIIYISSNYGEKKIKVIVEK